MDGTLTLLWKEKLAKSMVFFFFFRSIYLFGYKDKALGRLYLGFMSGFRVSKFEDGPGEETRILVRQKR